MVKPSLPRRLARQSPLSSALRMIKTIASILLAGILLSACASNNSTQPTPQISETGGVSLQDDPTAIPTRPAYSAGQLVDYTAQSGDTLPALASHFNTSVREIMD